MIQSAPSPAPPAARRPASWPDRLAPALLVASMVAFTMQTSQLARDKARGLMSEWPLDLTFFHNLVWNVTHGYGYRQSATYHEPPGIWNETHFEPILLLATPFYALFPTLETLFVVQAALLALGAVGVYRLARCGGADTIHAAGGGLLYLTFWPLCRMGLADVRPLTWSIPFLLLCAAALRERRLHETLLWGALACLCREEIPVLVAGLGAASWVWRRHDPDFKLTSDDGFRLASAALVLLVVATSWRSNAGFYIRPGEWIAGLLSGAGGEDPAQWGHDPGELLSTRLRFLAEWAVPAGAAALLAPELLLGAIPLMFFLFSQSHEWASWEGPYIHHSAPLVAFVAAAAALGLPRALRRLLPDRRRYGLAGGALLVTLLTVQVALLRDQFERVVRAEVEPQRDRHPRVLEAQRLARQVPPDAPVMADYSTVHLFSGRHDVTCYEQEEVVAALGPDGRLHEPLLPPAEVQPTWALVRLDHPAWIARAQAAGLSPIDRGDEWVLLGPRSLR